MIYDLRIRSDACIFDFMRLFPKGRVTANLFGCGVVMQSFITHMLWQCTTFENVPHGMQVCHKHAWPGAFFACACGYFKSILRAVILQASSAVNQRLLYRCSHSKNSGRMFSAFCLRLLRVHGISSSMVGFDSGACVCSCVPQAQV